MPPMGGVTGAMKGTGQRHTGAKVQKPKNLTATIFRLFSYMKGTKLFLLLALLSVIVSTVSTIAASYMLRPIINKYIIPARGAEDLPRLANALVIMALVYITGVVTTYSQTRLMLIVSQKALVLLRKDLYVHMQKLPISFFDRNSKGDLMSRFTNDVDVVGEMLSNTAVQLLSGAINIVGTFIMMVYTNIWLSLITFFMVPAIIKAGRFLVSKSRKYYSAQQVALGNLNGCIEETVSGQKVVKVFNHEQKAMDTFLVHNEELKDKQIKAQFFGGIMGPVVGNLGQVNYALTAVVGGILCVLRGFDVGGLTIFVTYARQFSRPVNEISMQMNTMFSALAGAERVFEIIDMKEENEEGKELHDVYGEIKLEHVTFGYDEGKTILKDINLCAKRGEKIAFVGSTGAGKTTITNLLNRFYEIDAGQILIDGMDIKKISLRSLRTNIALVLQETHLFTGTVMENIRYGRLDATDEEVKEAAKTANADYFIRRLSDGYQTVLEGDGINLSEGQRQLLNIARAALSRAPILVMDEATSSVDTITERLIQQGMDRLMTNRTTFVIAHRLSTIRDANAIMVLEHGEIIERGSHAELLAMKGRYYELYTGKVELE
jgi:ATP-binding cassette subfamily B protein